MDFRTLFCTVALFVLVSSCSGVWIYLEPRFDSQFAPENTEMIGREVYSQFPSGGQYSDQLVSRGDGPVELTRIPIRKRGHEVLNTIIGLPTKLRQRG